MGELVHVTRTFACQLAETEALVNIAAASVLRDGLDVPVMRILMNVKRAMPPAKAMNA